MIMPPVFVSLLILLGQVIGASSGETYEKIDETTGTSQCELVRKVLLGQKETSRSLYIHDVGLKMSSEEMMYDFNMPDILGANDGQNNVWSLTESGDSTSVSFVPWFNSPYPIRSNGATLDLLSRGIREYSLKGIQEFVDRPRYGLKRSPQESRVKVTQQSDKTFHAVFPPNDTDSVRGWIISIMGRRTEPVEEEAVQDLYFVQFPNDSLCTAESILKISKAMRVYPAIP